MTDLFDLIVHLRRQIEFSERTFGPGPRALGIVDHITKELAEIAANPADLEEWIDVIILGFDGAWRTGVTPEQIIAALVAKQAKNEQRSWPDWRTSEHGKAIEHDRGAEQVESTVRQCRNCGCTDDDCSGCIERTGTPCYWFEFDLCSACVTPNDLARQLGHGDAVEWGLLHAAFPYQLFIQATEILGEHPDDWDGPCYCAVCRSYG